MHLGVVLRYPALKLCGNFTKLYYTEIAAGPRALHNFSFRFCSLSTSKHVLSRALELLHEEVKSQRDDLKDMCHVIRIKEREVHSAKSSGSLQNESHKTHSIDDQKMQKILSELKAYSIRLSTLQAQAHTLHEDIDSMLSADVSQKEMVEAENFSIDSPYGSITSEHTTENNSTEVIDETDVLLETPRPDLEGEVGTEPITTIIDETQDMSITEVTQYLHENEVDFSDCFDAAALRQRYAEVKAGTWVDPKKERKRREMEERRMQERDAGYTPHPTQWDGKRSEGTRQERMNYGGSTEQGIIHDPYPGAERKMVDPMKFVWELKADFGRQKNFDPSRVDLWVGTTCLEDHKRLYEYPQLQGNPIEMRLKGDVPKSSPTFPGFNQK